MSAVVAVVIIVCLFQPCEGVAIHLQILLTTACRRRYILLSAAGHRHGSVIWQDPICAGVHDTGLDLSGRERPYVKSKFETSLATSY